MPFKTKTIALTVAGLLAAGGGVYAFTSGEPEKPASGAPVETASKAMTSDEVKALPDNTAPEAPMTDAVQPNGSAAQPTTAGSQAAPAAPKKLTREQLTPPAPKTEEEKLQKAAEQESNF